MNYKEALACLEALEVHGIVMGLDRVRRLLSELGDPHRRFRSVHIAGTNGKGSTAVYISSVLQEAGVRAGLYTSPHLHRFTERISISGEEIPPEQVVKYLEQILSIIRVAGPGFQPTYFEVTTAMAFAYFADAGVEFAVVEAGLGGRLDATNVLEPDISVITNIALEHTEYLGESIEAIAREKGGIIKEGADVVTGESDPRSLQVLQQICDEKGSRLIRAGDEIEIDSIVRNRRDGSRMFNYQGEEHQWQGLVVPLLGAYQVGNAMLALGVFEALIRKRLKLPETAIRKGLSNARWPGRMEVASADPYIILDGAHNPHASQALVTTLKEDLTYRRLILVIGILQDKDIPAMVSPLLACADQLILTKPHYYRGADPLAFLEEIKGGGLPLTVKEGISDAVDYVVSLYRPGDLILITGSLYTVGEAREYLCNKITT